MALWNVQGQYIDDAADENMRMPETALRIPEYRNVAQFGGESFQWDPQGQAWYGRNIAQTSPGYLTELLGLRDRVRQGQAQPWEAAQLQQWEEQARAIPTRDIAALTAGWQGGTGSEKHHAWEAETPEWWSRLDPGSPDVGPIMLQIADRMERGQATPQERQLYSQVSDMATDWAWRASVPQASDAFSPLGDNLFGALGVLALGATGGLAAAPLAAGGASLATTLGSLGTLSGVAGTGAGVLGQALDQPWLSQVGLGLGALGGIAGGVGGLANLWGTGVQSLGDAARLAQSAGRITGAVGTASGNDALRQASRYLGQAGQLGNIASGLLPTSFTDWSGTNAPLAANIAPQVASGGVQNLLSAADMATQRGGRPMGEYDWLGLDLSSGGDMGGAGVWAGGSPTFNEGGGASWWDMGGAGVLAPQPGSQSWADYYAWTPQGGWNAGGPGSGVFAPEWQQSGQDVAWAQSHPGAGVAGAAAPGWLSTLGGLASGALGFLGKNAGTLGPLLAGAGGIASGALGANASNEAARLQAAALNRGIDLSTSQWLEQLARTAPWVQAGQQALGTMQGLAGQQGPPLPGAAAAIDPRAYGMPNATPGWQQRAYQGPQAPNAADYRYSAPATVDLAQHAWNAPQAMDPAQYAFNTPGGQELLAKDPGYQFRQEEARKALEASALARGMGMSGATLQALQARSQDIASAEYQNAYQRALGENQLRYGRGMTQTQEDYQRQLQANQLRYGRASEQQQLGYQQGLGAQGFNWQTALQGQQNAFNQGLTAEQYLLGQQQKAADDYYQRVMDQYKTTMGLDIAQNQTNYERQQQLYRQQLAQSLLPWEQQSTLATLGGQMTGQLGAQGIQATSGIANLLGQLGSSQALGPLGGALNWQQAISGGVGGLQNVLRGLNA